MTSDDRTDRNGSGTATDTPLREWLRNLYRLTPWGLRRLVGGLQTGLDELVRRLGHVDVQLGHIDARFDGVDHRFDAVEDTLGSLQAEIESLRDDRTARIEERVDGAQETASAAEAEAARLRNTVLPAAVARGNVLVDALAEQLEELASLVERMLRSEPLPAPAAGPSESALADGLAEVQPQLVEVFRGTESEIRHRLEHHLPTLRSSTPVLDLGCGRGELLLLLRDAGVEARGVEADAALAQAARRRGLDVIEGDVLDVLADQAEASCGAVAAIHLVEHLEQSSLLALLRQVHRVLKPGGVLLIECPNPHSLRVGASLFWIDPTHRRPLPPETLDLYLKSCGFEVREIETLHSFPEEQRLHVDLSGLGDEPQLRPLADAVERLASRLDALICGERDYAVVAMKPGSQ